MKRYDALVKFVDGNCKMIVVEAGNVGQAFKLARRLAVEESKKRRVSANSILVKEREDGVE
jgi:hypothetical protein